MCRVMRMAVVTFLLVLGIAVAGCSSSPDQSPVIQAGGPAPDFQLLGLDGQTVSLVSLRGRPVMLNFWATWCNPCRMEMPFIQEVFEDTEWKEQELVILAVNLGEDASKVTKFLEDNGFSFTVLLDTDGSVAENYDVSGIPTTFFIDKNGIIKDRKTGTFSSKADIDWRLINSILKGE